MVAVIRENLENEGYILTLHETYGLPAYKRIKCTSIEEAKKQIEKFNLTWYEADEDCDGDVVEIGY